MKIYDRTEALEAMYDLKEQGYRDITLRILEDGTIYLGCNSNDKFVEPKISIDDIDSWSQNPKDYRNEFTYWWIFD